MSVDQVNELVERFRPVLGRLNSMSLKPACEKLVDSLVEGERVLAVASGMFSGFHFLTDRRVISVKAKTLRTDVEGVVTLSAISGLSIRRRWQAATTVSFLLQGKPRKLDLSPGKGSEPFLTELEAALAGAAVGDTSGGDTSGGGFCAQCGRARSASDAFCAACGARLA